MRCRAAAKRCRRVGAQERPGQGAWSKKWALFFFLPPFFLQSAYAQAQELGKASEEGKQVLQAFSEVYDMGGADKVDPTKPPRWIPDDNVNECSACKDAFSLVRRKHHCRACGGIFCGKCSSGAVPLAKFDMQKNVRVCDACFATVMAQLGQQGGGEKAVSARSPRGQSPPPGASGSAGKGEKKERKERSRSRGRKKEDGAS